MKITFFINKRKWARKIFRISNHIKFISGLKPKPVIGQLLTSVFLKKLKIILVTFLTIMVYWKPGLLQKRKSWNYLGKICPYSSNINRVFNSFWETFHSCFYVHHLINDNKIHYLGNINSRKNHRMKRFPKRQWHTAQNILKNLAFHGRI